MIGSAAQIGVVHHRKVLSCDALREQDVVNATAVIGVGHHTRSLTEIGNGVIGVTAVEVAGGDDGIAVGFLIILDILRHLARLSDTVLLTLVILFSIEVGAGEDEHLSGGLHLKHGHTQVAHTLNAAPIVDGIADKLTVNQFQGLGVVHHSGAHPILFTQALLSLQRHTHRHVGVNVVVIGQQLAQGYVPVVVVLLQADDVRLVVFNRCGGLFGTITERLTPIPAAVHFIVIHQGVVGHHTDVRATGQSLTAVTAVSGNGKTAQQQAEGQHAAQKGAQENTHRLFHFSILPYIRIGIV